MDYSKSSLCQLDDLKLSCFGCCGLIIGKKIAVEETLNKNTEEFNKSQNRLQDKSQNGSQYVKDFIWRFAPNNLRPCGICPNLVFDDVRKNKVYCPGHPEKNNQADHRDGYCDTLHLCKTAFLFSIWPDDLKERFLAFIKFKVKKHQLDWYSYSRGMDNGSLLVEFEESAFWNK